MRQPFRAMKIIVKTDRSSKNNTALTIKSKLSMENEKQKQKQMRTMLKAAF